MVQAGVQGQLHVIDLSDEAAACVGDTQAVRLVGGEATSEHARA